MRQVIALSVLLGLAMVGSYLTWTGDGESEATGDEVVTVYHASPTELQKLLWTSEKVDIEVERKTDERGDYTWITSTERKEKAQAKPKSKDQDEAPEANDEAGEEGEDAAPEEVPEPEAPAEIETTVTHFRGNQAAEDLWAAFAPLHALRELQTDDIDAEVFGFAEPTATLEVTRKSGTVTLTVGGETYGSLDKYVKVDSKVFLVDNATVRPLQFGKTRLLERNLQPLGEADTESVKITTPSGDKVFVQHNRDDRAKAFWATPEDAETEHPSAGTWLGKVYKMRARNYVVEADIEAQLEPVFTYEFIGKDESWPIEILREVGVEKPNYYARASYLRSLVELTNSLASDAVDDLDSVMQ